MIDLMDLLPSSYDDNATMKELQGILSNNINNLQSNFDKTIDECFIDTSKELLSRYENMYGLKTDVSKSDEFRRELIKAKIRGIGTVTKEMVQAVAQSYNNGLIEVIEHNSNYYFEILFIGNDGIPSNLSGLKSAVEQIKPAHLGIIYNFKFLIWDILDSRNLTWDDLDSRNLNWDAFEGEGWI